MDNDVAAKLKNIRDQLSTRLQILTRWRNTMKMAYSKLIEDELWYDDGDHLTQTSHYAAGKLSLLIDGFKTLFFL